MPDAYDDLAALADLQPPDPRYGRVLRRTGEWWSYPGCTLDGINLKVPRFNAGDARVKAAIAEGVWFAQEVDAAGRPVVVMPVATSAFADRPPLKPQDVGTAKALPPGGADTFIRFELQRGRPPVFAGHIDAVWKAAWSAGETPDPTGSNLGDRHLVLEMPVRFHVNDAWVTPTVGDDVIASGQYGFGSSKARYTVKEVHEPSTRRYILVLSRLRWPGNNA